MRSSERIHVVAFVRPRAGAEAEVERILRALVDATRAEPGCVRYELLRDGSPPQRFAFIEVWESDAALDAHLRGPNVEAAGRALQPFLLAAPEITRLWRLT